MDVHSTETDNPFSIFADQERSSARSMISTIKMLLLAIVAFGLSIWGHQAWQSWRLGELANSLRTQSPDQQVETLAKIAEFDTTAIDQLVQSLDSPSAIVATAAAGHIDEMLKAWMLMPTRRRDQNLLALARTISTSESPSIHARRIAEKLIRETSEASGEASQAIVELAVTTISRCTTDSAENVLAVSNAQAILVSPMSSPLPMENAQDELTSWPPTASRDRLPNTYVAQTGSAPSVLRGRITSVSEIPTQPVLLRQAERHVVDAVTSEAKTEESKPQTRPRSSPVIQPVVHQAVGLEITSIDQAEANLASPSRLVRLKAIHFLSKKMQESNLQQDAQRAREILQGQLCIETDRSAQHRIRLAIE